MLRCVLLIYILSNYFSDTYEYSREQINDDYDHKNDDYTSLKQIREDVKEDDFTGRREWNQFIETLKTNEKLLRLGKPSVHVNDPLLTKKPNARRSVLNWFNNLFPKIDTTTTTSRPSMAAKELNNAESNLTEILIKLNQVLDKFNENIEKNNGQNKTYYVVEIPISVDNVDSEGGGRVKREASDVTVVAEKENKTALRDNDDAVYNITNINENTDNIDKSKTGEGEIGNVYSNDKDEDDEPVINIKGKRREKRNVDVDTSNTTVEKANGENVTNYIEYLYKQNNKTSDLNKTNDVDSNVTHVINTRRSFNRPKTIRTKLMEYLYDIFEEIKVKLSPIVTLKKRFSNDVAFKIGYITANLNSLESNLARLKSDMEGNASSWDENEILNIFDVLKTYSNVVMKLVNSLKFYLRRMKLA